ncbi:uncharacterized protein LOC123563035 [Mercenaria mercenaria]|uniref:uncharacterized protein LOC123563035 n=1 Tax=Mercenaria mercenaria TaxID=6596 RepID=UPI00234F58A6|nr:uncharacterized protein LOC123563035 [Mercenaria mercenaria]
MAQMAHGWVLNGYAKLLAREANDATDSSVRMFIIPSYTASLWDAGMYKTYLFKRVDFSLYDLIVVPWNKNGNHWVVLVARTKDFTVSVYDSLNADNSLLIDRFCLFMSERSKIVNGGFDQWLSVQPPTNKQSDGSSCGVFVLMTLECLVNGKPSLILRQVHVLMFRRYVKDRLLAKGIRSTHLCDSLTCKDPRGEGSCVMYAPGGCVRLVHPRQWRKMNIIVVKFVMRNTVKLVLVLVTVLSHLCVDM